MKSSVVFRKYDSEDLPVLKAIFFSNVPVYFHEREWADFHDFLQDDINENSVYHVCLSEGKIVGAGGIALNEDGTVSMTWGMVHGAVHKTGLGKVLLTHRLDLSAELFAGRQVGLSTTQHACGFFEKFGFVISATEKDFWAPGLDLYKMILAPKQ